MRKIDYITKDTRTLADFLDLAQSDGLQAKGCSLDLLLPQNESGSWEGWLNETVVDEIAAAEEIDELRRMVDKAASRREELNTVVASNIQRAYRTMKQREDETAKLPQEVKAYIAGYANQFVLEGHDGT